MLLNEIENGILLVFKSESKDQNKHKGQEKNFHEDRNFHCYLFPIIYVQ